MLSTASMPFAACDLWSVLHVLVFISNAYGIYTIDFWFVTFAISLTLSLDQFCAKREGNPTTISCATSYWASLCPFHQKALKVRHRRCTVQNVQAIGVFAEDAAGPIDVSNLFAALQAHWLEHQLPESLLSLDTKLTIGSSVKLWAPETHADIGSAYASPSSWNRSRYVLLGTIRREPKLRSFVQCWYLYQTKVTNV